MQLWCPSSCYFFYRCSCKFSSPKWNNKKIVPWHQDNDKNWTGQHLRETYPTSNRREQADLDDCDHKTFTSTQFLQIQKNEINDLQEHLERYCNVLPIFGFNSAEYDLNLIKSCLLPIPVNERNIEPTVIKKGNQFISFKFGGFQLLDIMNSLGGAASLDSFLKAYKASEATRFFPYEWFDHPDKKQNTELPRMMLSSVNFAAATLSKPNTRTTLTYGKVDWPENRPSSTWNCQSYPILELRIIITCNRYVSKNKWAHSRTFCGG